MQQVNNDPGNPTMSAEPDNLVPPLHQVGALRGQPKFTPGQGSGLKRQRNSKGGFKRAVRLTDERKSLILVQLRRGCHLETAFALANVPGTTYRSWMMQARTSLDKAEKGERVTERQKQLIKFFVEVERAQAEAEVRAVSNVHQAASTGSWQAALAFLERRYPERWAKREERDLNVNVAVGFGYVQVTDNQDSNQPTAPATDNHAPGTPIPASHQLTNGDPP